jgi:hypothetical protein
MSKIHNKMSETLIISLSEEYSYGSVTFALLLGNTKGVARRTRRLDKVDVFVRVPSVKVGA